jgi:putative Mg2+ transporter-C (MgtC) family protein
LTTASTIWTVAALGMGIGSGQLLFVAVVTGILMVVLLVFPLIERFIGRFAEARTYEIVSRKDGYTPVDLQRLWKQYNLHVRRFKQGKQGEVFHTVWEVSGMPKNHDQIVERLYADEKILEFSF